MSYEFGHCRREELPELADFCNRIFRCTRPGDMCREYPLLFADNLDNLLVARFEGRIVAHVGVCLRDATILGAGVRVASIGSVGTELEHRGQRLAGRLMANARAQSVERGASLMLISGGRGLYRRLGYVDVGNFQRYTAPAGESGEGIALEVVDETRLPAVIRLHQHEPVRFIRPLDDWRKLLHAGRLLNQASELLLIHRHGEPAAYAGVRLPTTDPSGTRGSVLIGEFGGSRRALAAALPAVASRHSAPAWELVARGDDTPWSAEATARGWLPEPHGFPGTLGIIDSGRFLHAIRPLLSERAGDDLTLSPEGEGARLTADNESVVLEDFTQLTALLFGGASDDAKRLPPLPPALRAVAEIAFPLPLLWYGYNYV